MQYLLIALFVEIALGYCKIIQTIKIQQIPSWHVCPGGHKFSIEGLFAPSNNKCSIMYDVHVQQGKIQNSLMSSKSICCRA